MSNSNKFASINHITEQEFDYIVTQTKEFFPTSERYPHGELMYQIMMQTHNENKNADWSDRRRVRQLKALTFIDNYVEMHNIDIRPIISVILQRRAALMDIDLIKERLENYSELATQFLESTQYQTLNDLNKGLDQTLVYSHMRLMSTTNY